MAPLKVDAANRGGDIAALADAMKNFEELEMANEAESARSLIKQIERLKQGISQNTLAC